MDAQPRGPGRPGTVGASRVGGGSRAAAIVANLEWNVQHEVSPGGGMLARATALPDLKPISKSITVRAWRLRTREGQTLYVTRVEKRKGAGRTAAAS